MMDHFRINELRAIKKSCARRLILEAFRTGEIDANTAFYFAVECNIELRLV